MGDHHPLGPLGIDPLHFSAFLFGLLVSFVLYLLLPRGLRVHHFGSYPKRYAWSARNRASRRGSSLPRQSQNAPPPGSTIGGSSSIITGTTGGLNTASSNPHHRHLHAQGIGVGGGGGSVSNASAYSSVGSSMPRRGRSGHYDGLHGNEEQVVFDGHQQGGGGGGGHPGLHTDLQQNEEIVISAAMQQLRDPGVLIVAHGSRGKPKTVRLQLTESAITWRTETRKKGMTKDQKPKLGKLHQVPLSHIMYVDVGKQTTALRRVENASVSEALCFSLLTKEGSLDLEASSPRERDALVSCFSLVLDEVHAQNWRDIYRGPSSDMPSSFDEFEQQQGGGEGGDGGQQGGGGAPMGTAANI